jgi:hypothetical protein
MDDSKKDSKVVPFKHTAIAEPVTWIEDYLAKRVTFDYVGRCTLDGVPTNYTKLLAELTMHAYKLEGHKVPQHVIKSAITLAAEAQKEKVRDYYKAFLRFDPEKADLVRDILGQFLLFLTGAPAQPVDIAVLAHFIWQVKRKLYGKKVVYHMMPIVTGPQGVGKSEQARRLFSPIRELSTEQTFEVFTDSRKFYMFNDFYVMFLDEMTGARKTELAALKQKIAAEEITERKLGTNSSDTYGQNSTFIATTNTQFIELLKDETGARRFWEIQSRRTADPSVWPAMNSLAYTDLWQGIDENSPQPPIFPVWTEIQAQQRDVLTARNYVQDWLAECTEPDDKGTGSTELYTSYRDWAEERRADRFHCSHKFFGMEMRKAVAFTDSSSRKTVYKVRVIVPQLKGQGQ